ncbi:Fe-S cluster assembly scaffold SufA [Pleomorphomonas koreensis]|uniref:Fe-S cluster assembly scaffold SufA n=1 Tax=Pleomorphomonas koreensis TaxID=257440 RepID=UPI00040177DF|nr:Fe-S cluster assembly scaffold SufA [Pleomorphomonas koreensis]
MALAKFAVMTLTESAAARVREIVDNAEDAIGVRLGIKNGGCAGMSYTLNLAREAQAGDERVEAHGVTVFVEAKAVLFLLGTEMDFEQTPLRTGFVFRNPNQVGACGCGESVSLKPAEQPAEA